MGSSGCAFGLALVLGFLIGGLFLAGGAQYRSAMTKIKAVQTEKKKFNEAVTKARQKRSEGYSELIAAAFLILGSITLLIVATLLLSGSQIF